MPVFFFRENLSTPEDISAVDRNQIPSACKKGSDLR
jgi:hypothetical protein